MNSPSVDIITFDIHHHQEYDVRKLANNDSSSISNTTAEGPITEATIPKWGTSIQQIPHSACQNDNHCMNQGQCVAHPFIVMNTTNSTYYYKTCTCINSLYSGSRCENFCPLNCQNGGVCYYKGKDDSYHAAELSRVSDYACKCYGYYTGSICQTSFANCGDYRTSTATANNNTHTNVQCYNGGICLEEPINVTTTTAILNENNTITNVSVTELQYCQCPPGYIGLDCSKPIRIIPHDDHEFIHQRTGLASFFIGTGIALFLAIVLRLCYQYRYYNKKYQFLKSTMNEYEGISCTEPYNIRDYAKNAKASSSSSMKSNSSNSNSSSSNKNTGSSLTSFAFLYNNHKYQHHDQQIEQASKELKQAISHLYNDSPIEPQYQEQDQAPPSMPSHSSNGLANHGNHNNNNKNRNKPKQQPQIPKPKRVQWKNIV